MIKSLQPNLRSCCNSSNRNLHAIQSPNFKNEQSSNDYIISLCKQKLFGKALQAFDLFQKHTQYNLYSSTYANLISACSSMKSLEHGRKVHNHIMTSNCQPDRILLNHILNMYGKCGSPGDARKVFEKMSERNVVSWTSLIAGYSQHGHSGEAISLYMEMQQESIMPDHFTYGSVIRACANLMEVNLGEQLHAHVVKSVSGNHLIAQNALIAMYTKFGKIHEALKVFSCIQSKDLISWSSIISGFSQLGYELEALWYFKKMLSQGLYWPNEFIFGSVFSACGILLQPEYGRQMHGMSIKCGFHRDAFAGCSLTDMYAKCGFLHSAKAAFDQIEDPDLASWNAVIAGFAYAGDVNQAVSTFSQMRHLEFTPDDITIRSLLCAFTSPFALNQGKQLHSYVTKIGLDGDIPVCNTLVSMYANCLEFFDAFKMFDVIGNSADLVSWNAVLTVCMHHNKAGEVFLLLKKMLPSAYKPDHITLVSVLGACGRTASLEMGDQVHCYSMKSGLDRDMAAVNGMIDMYVKCGSLESARKLFDWIESPDTVSWSTMIVGYAQFGYGEEALKLFEQMSYLGVPPNQVTFVGVLTACSHVGLVEEGWRLFNNMEMKHGIIPTREHWSCVVDLLARAGCINEAETVINQMPFDPDTVMWKTLLAACKTHNNIVVGKRAAENILKIDPSNCAAHVLLCSIYASTGNWKGVSSLRSLMKYRGIKKVPGQSWIEMKDNIHVFLAEDNLHPDRDKIYMMLEELWLQMLDAGYAPGQKEKDTGRLSGKTIDEFMSWFSLV